MGRNYDNWERLVEAVTRREQIRSLCLADSRSPSIRSIDSDYSFSSSSRHDNLSFSTTPSPSHTGQAKRRNAIWKGLPIFSDFSSKRGELQWVKAQRILHGLEPVKTVDVYCKQNNEEVSRTTEMAKKRAEVSLMTEMAKRKAEIARLRELHTLKGHIESIVKIKGLDIGSINLHYTI